MSRAGCPYDSSAVRADRRSVPRDLVFRVWYCPSKLIAIPGRMMIVLLDLNITQLIALLPTKILNVQTWTTPIQGTRAPLLRQDIICIVSRASRFSGT